MTAVPDSQLAASELPTEDQLNATLRSFQTSMSVAVDFNYLSSYILETNIVAVFLAIPGTLSLLDRLFVEFTRQSCGQH